MNICKNFFLLSVLFVSHLEGTVFPLHEAARRGDYKAIETLIMEKLRKDQEGLSEDVSCCSAIWAKIVNFFEDQNVSINVQDRSGNTALHYASFYKNFKIVKLLVDAGADLNVQNSLGNTPLHSAAWKGAVEIAVYLIDAGADVHLKNDRGYTAFDCAKSLDFINLKEKLIEYQHTKEKKSTMWNLWAMETYEFNSYIQWLPKECCEDIESLL